MATKKKAAKEIVRTVRFNGQEFGPGAEDELAEAVKNHTDNDEDFDEQAELERLTRMGALIGFASVDEEDLQELDGDRVATVQSGNRAVLQERHPVARQGRGPQSMDEAQHEPDRNRVEELARGGGSKARGQAVKDRATVRKGLEKARAEKAESEVQQESEQIPTQSPEQPLEEEEL